MDGKRLVSEATTTAYQQDFRNLFMALSSNPTHEEWKDLYRRLVHWELEMTRSDISGNDGGAAEPEEGGEHRICKYVAKITAAGFLVKTAMRRFFRMSCSRAR